MYFGGEGLGRHRLTAFREAVDAIRHLDAKLTLLAVLLELTAEAQ
jgi:hypothetical protein